jgi:hypothetical protein
MGGNFGPKYAQEKGAGRIWSDAHRQGKYNGFFAPGVKRGRGG